MRLTLFLTHTLSLRTWHDMGTFDREVAIYRKLQNMGVSIDIVSYGGREEYEFRSQLPDMRILCNWIGWSSKRYTYRLHQLHGLRLWQSDLFKTNQLNGAQVAVRASRLWHRPMIARFGYLWSAFAEQTEAPESKELERIHRIQNEAFAYANRVVMTSPLMLDDVRQAMPTIDDKVTIIPNYVDTDLFRPHDVDKQYDLVFVGRVTAQKNLDNLLSALRNTNHTLAIVGDGDCYESLRQKFADIEDRVFWLGRVNHLDLPKVINQGRVFILPSDYEGHPKALIEAMACGMPVIGTRVRGIRQIIEHGQNGYLCETSIDSLFNAITEVLAKPELMLHLGQFARNFVVENYSLDMIVEMEYKLYQDVLKNRRGE